MSGICGFVRTDGAPAEARLATAMGGALAHRGGDGTGVHADGPAALAATLRHDTPESLRERQPLVGAGGLVLVADARIDNRDELIATLGRRDSPPPTDADLILSACAAWGDDAPARLLGDFAFALWDPGRRRLFCARDALGVRPLCYSHRSGRLFSFASETKALFELPEMTREVDELSLLAYLDGRDLPHETTFFEGVRRLPPGHTLVLDNAGIRVERYWYPDPEREVRMPRLSDYVDSFREHFDRAVTARLRSVHPVGTMLSGGLDSSSITATVRRLVGEPLATFSFRFDGVPASDERRYQEALLATGAFSPRVVRGDALDPFIDFDRVIYHADEPTGAGNLFLSWAAWGMAREAGVGVVLDGFFGDSAVPYGDDLLPELLRSGRLLAFGREAVARRRVSGGGRRMVVALIASSLRAALPQALRPGTMVSALTSSSEVFVPLHPAAAGRLPARTRSPGDEGYHTVRGRQYEDVLHEAYAPVFEVLDKAAAGRGIDLRFPFADRRLVEHTLALPADVKQRDGWDRWVLRSAMDGRLPDSVRWRRGKGDLLPNLGHVMRTLGRKRLAAELEDPQGPLARFVDQPALAEQLRRFDAGDSEPVPPLWTAACASAWLRAQRASTPNASHQTGPRFEA